MTLANTSRCGPGVFNRLRLIMVFSELELTWLVNGNSLLKQHDELDVSDL
jgi:hypothetical protein